MKKIQGLTFLFLFAAAIASGQTDTTTVATDDEFVPVITLSATDFEGDDEAHDISGLLQGSRDIFLSTAGYTFGSARFRIRGYNSENSSVLINGVPVNDPETGRAYYSTWGGLNDAMRNTVNSIGLAASQYAFGGFAGVNNIELRASQYRPQTRVTYSSANRSYRNRAMFIHSTGLVDDKWAMTVSGSKRWAQQGYSEGTFYDAYAYFLSAERKFNNNHSIGLTAFGAPMKSGRPGLTVQEAYDLTGNQYYNPNWGYQNGEVRNARVNNYHKPMILLTHYWELENTSINTSVTYSFGRGGNTALNWYDAADPRPDYYRYLPSYWANDEYMFGHVTNLWQNDDEYRQLDWHSFYKANSKNMYGAPGDVVGNRSKYIIEERRNDQNRWTFNTVARNQLNSNILLTGGLDVSLFKGSQFKVVNDLLGGDWWIDVDQFAERDFADENLYQNDLNNPNRLVQVGDRFGYDFVANINTAELFAQSEFSYAKVDFFVAANLSNTQFWRTGNMQNGRFPHNSYGDSEKQKFYNYGIKGGVTYKITGRHYIDFNAGYQTRAPYFRNSYISSRVRDHVVDGLKSEQIFATDLSYIVRAPKVKSRFTVYYSENTDQAWNRSFYHEGYRTFINYIMTDVDTRNVGAELGVEVNVTPDWTLNAVGAWGHYTYNSRPNVTVARDNDFEMLAENRTVYFKNFFIGGFPQMAGSVGTRYNAPRYWFAGANFNYFGKTYIDINPDRRTEEALDGLVVSDPQWGQLLNQQKLNDGYTLDFFVGKSWRIDRKYYIRVNLSVSNVLNNRDLTVIAFEQLRFDNRDIDRFPPKYAYMYGTNYFLNVNFSF
ncbi:MAG: TonB-dependent receptor plug domain-containing protein [Bacteroidales bacterium]|nr:TonB-dependent receptor plug domain-containing protein [Bacteroidales bacterium]MDD4673499.1 TonB-dependent receptor plug domain-containing protein [Bacteroidales bacterium]